MVGLMAGSSTRVASAWTASTCISLHFWAEGDGWAIGDGPRRFWMLRRAERVPVTFEAHGVALSHQATSCCAWCRESEQGAIERIQARARQADTAKPKREHGVVGVAGVVHRRPVGGQDGEVGLPVELVVERLEERGGLLSVPAVLEPPSADLGVGATVYPSRALVPDVSPPRRSPRLNAARPAGSSNGWASWLQGREPRRPPKVDEDGGRLLPADAAGTLRVFPEGAQVAVAA